MADLFLDIYATDLTIGCCPNNVAAVLFNQSHLALKETAPNVWAMTAYTSAGHDDFCIILSEHAQRTWYYSTSLDESYFTLAATPEGEYYTIEYWYHEGAVPFVRASDTLLESRRVMWDGTKFIDAKLSTVQENSMANWLAVAAVSYDSSNNTVHIIGHLERNGVLITDSQYMSISWYKTDGTAIISVTVSTYIPNADGIFSLDYPNIDLTPDLVTPIIVTIRDVDDNDHISAVSVASWD